MVHEGQRFGHRVWCSIVVDQAEILEVPSAAPEIVEVVEELPAQAEVVQVMPKVTEVTEVPEKEKLVVQGQTDEDIKELKDEMEEEVPKEEQKEDVEEQEDHLFMSLDQPPPELMAGISAIKALQCHQQRNTSQTVTPNNTPLESRGMGCC